MGVNKVVYGTTTIIDISDSTVSGNKMLKGTVAYGANGDKVTGNILTYNYDRCPAYTYGSDETKVYVEGEIGQGNPIFVDDGLVNLEIPLTEFGDAKASDVLASKTFTSSSGRKVTGTIQNKTNANVYVDEGQVIVDAGYYPSNVTKEIDSVTQATPSITVSSAGLITAKSVQTEGYVAGGTKKATKQLTTQAAKTVTPTTTNQTAVASGRYTTGAVTVKGDTNLKAENIKKDVTIFGVKGTYEGSSGGSVETCTVTLMCDFGGAPVPLDGTEIYYTDANMTPQNVLFDADTAITISVAKNTIAFLTEWSSACLSSSNIVAIGGMGGYKGYWVKGDGTLTYRG